MRFRRSKEPAKITALRLRAVEMLDRSIEAAAVAERALDAGKPADCPEVAEARRLMHEANEALAEWKAAGGVEALI